MIRAHQALLTIVYLIFFVIAAGVVSLHFMYQEFFQATFFGSIGGMLLCAWGAAASVKPSVVVKRRSVYSAVVVLALIVVVCGIFSVKNTYSLDALTQSEKLGSVLKWDLGNYFILPGIVIVHRYILSSTAKRRSASS